MLHYDMYAPSIQTVAEKQRVMDRLLAKEPNYRKGDAAVTAKIAQNYPTAVINARQTVSNLLQQGLPGLEDTDERNRWLCQKPYGNYAECGVSAGFCSGQHHAFQLGICSYAESGCIRQRAACQAPEHLQ